MAAGSFTLTRRNNKSGYVILRTMQRATVRYENIDCLCRNCDAALLLFDMNISTTFAACYYLVWKYRLTVSYIRCSPATLRHEDINCVRSPRKMQRATVCYPILYQRACSSIPVSWHLEGIYGKRAGETSEYHLCPSRILRFCQLCNPASFKIRELDCTMQYATVRYENIDCL